MLLLLQLISLPFAVVLGQAINEGPQHPLLDIPSSSRLALGLELERLPGDSIVRLCPESRETDVLAIERIVNSPQVPYLYVLK